MQKKYRGIFGLESELVLNGPNFNNVPKLGEINFEFIIPSLYPLDTFNGQAVDVLSHMNYVLGSDFDQEVTKKNEEVFHVLKMAEEIEYLSENEIASVVEWLFDEDYNQTEEDIVKIVDNCWGIES